MVLIPTYIYDNWRDIQNKLEENRCKNKSWALWTQHNNTI